jgi:hypothetical protein
MVITARVLDLEEPGIEGRIVEGAANHLQQVALAELGRGQVDGDPH